MESQSSSNKTLSATSGLSLACLLGTGLLLVSYARLAGDAATPAFKNPKVIATTLAGPIWQSRLGLNIALFTLAMLALHLALGLACWLLARLSQRAWPGRRITRHQWLLIWFLAGVSWLLVANATLFPRSSLGSPYQDAATAELFGVTPYAILSTCVGAAVVIVVLLAALRTFGTRIVGMVVCGAGLVPLAGGLVSEHGLRNQPVPQAPNVILLGIDSLRPDLVTDRDAPHVRHFIEQSVNLIDAITPLARTFPSWVSILTGRHPHTTGAVMNLLPRELIRTGPTLPELLRQKGYQTIYAIDETRFSNIDASYGFNHTATPTIGSSDFLLAWFADTPLSNVVMNTRLGALLFPHVHANRAAHVTYEPDSFVRRIERAVDTRGPVFLAAHFTLPHWPWVWATKGEMPSGVEGSRARYMAAVRRADRQFADALAMLKERGLLENAVVVVLSDHGEAFGPDDGFLSQAYPDPDEPPAVSELGGHGNSVFSPPQYRVVLAFRAYGPAATLISGPRTIPEPVSLLDIAPTILDLLKIRSDVPMDGLSLAPLFSARAETQSQFPDRIRFTESEYNPKGFSPDSLSASALATAVQIYRIDPHTDRLVVRSEMLDWIMASRQFGAISGDSLMAAVPGPGGIGAYRFVNVPGPTGPMDAQAESRMKLALQQRFGFRLADDGGPMRSPAP